VISETEFSQKYTSLWHQVLPMADGIVRRINVDYERFGPELQSNTSPMRRGYVNELGFRIFASSVMKGELQYPEPKVGLLSELEEETARYIARLRSTKISEPPTIAERREAIFLSQRLYKFFISREPGSNLRVHPEFAGCGILNTCVGDVYAEPTLYEIKAGARDFRLIDIRQVVTYCALNFEARRYDIQRVILLNPRLGIYATLPIHDDVARASGLPAAEVYSQILDFLSQDLASNYSSRVR
jgi:hypothetical protein